MDIFRVIRPALLIACALPPSASGGVFSGAAYDGFGYPAGEFGNTSSGGSGWNAAGAAGQPNATTWGISFEGTTFFNPGATAANQSVTDAYLEHPAEGFPTPAGGAVLISGPGQIGRAFGQQIDSGTFYFSYLTRKTVDQVRSMNFSFFGTNERLAFGQIANNTNIRDQDGNWLSGEGANSGAFVALVSNAQNSPVASPADPESYNGVHVAASPRSYAVDTTFLIIGKIEFDHDGGPADRITYYIDPASVADESSLIPYLVIDHIDIGAINGFRMFSGGSQTAGADTFLPSAAIFDEIRFGPTFAAVTTAVAEPPAVTEWQEWLDLHFSAEEQEDETVSGPDEDADADGSSNFLEFALGSDPRSGAGPVLAGRPVPGGFALDYPAPRSGVNYVVETSTDLEGWGTSGVMDVPAGGSAPEYLRTATVPRSDEGTGFLRLRVAPKD